MNPWPFLLVFTLPVSVPAGYGLGGWCTFITPLLVFGLIPVIDLLAGLNTWNPAVGDEKVLQDRWSFRIITWLCVPAQVAMVAWGAYTVGDPRTPLLEGIGITASIGTAGGILGINIAHELIHRVGNRYEPLLGRISLWTVCYLHWAIEHVAGHHKNVATPFDPATAAYGESFYSFLPGTVFGGYHSAWEIESRRLERLKRPRWSAANRIIRYELAQAALVAAAGYLFGYLAAVYIVVQGLIAVLLLEIVNYIEHYGLERRRTGEARYEKPTRHHAWNAANRITNYFLFNLQRHGDHHYAAWRRYQILLHYPDSPQLPTGYAGMIPAALIPPLWRKIMHPRAAGVRGTHTP